jgi:hypothetical protein
MKLPKWMQDSMAGVIVALVSTVGNGYYQSQQNKRAAEVQQDTAEKQRKEGRRAERLAALREYSSACSRISGVMELVAVVSSTRLRALAPGSTAYVQNLADRSDELLGPQVTELATARADLYAKLAVANAVFGTNVSFPAPASAAGPPAESTPTAAKENIAASQHVGYQCAATVGEFQKRLQEP